MRTSRILATIGAVGIVLGLAIWLLGYSPREFRGAGPMRDDGLVSYPRYRAPLGDLRLDLEGAHAFEFTGLPSEQLSLMLYIEGRFSTREIASLTTTLAARITDQAGNVVCAASGSPVESERDRRWVLMSAGGSLAALWHHRCLDAAFRRRTGYVLEIRVTEPDPSTPRVTLHAVLEGGGIELP